MSSVLEEAGYEVRSTDICSGTDFLQETEPWDGSIVTNPPYSLANAFLERALDLATEQVAMLLPLHALGGKKRYMNLWSVMPPALMIVVVNRMPLQNGSSSQFNHVWVVWDQRRSGDTATVFWDQAD